MSKTNSSNRILKYLLILFIGLAAGASYIFITKSNIIGSNEESDTLEMTKGKPSNTSEKRKKSVRLSGFPALNEPFEFAGIEYTFTDVKIERQGLSYLLTLSMNLYCADKVNPCHRAKSFIIVDGETFLVRSQKRMSSVHANSRKSDQLGFKISSFGESYQIKFKRENKVWIRDFKVLRE